MNSTYPPRDQEQAQAGVAINVPKRWAKFLARCLHLEPGRYTIVLSVYGDRCDWSVKDAGRIES